MEIQLLTDIKKLLTLQAKEVFTIEEYAEYCGISKYTAYKHTSNNLLPFYRVGKLIYIKREDAVAFLLKNRVASASEVESKALNNM
ncbi:MAG: helix-turn-helix domain-containing protein [Chitinophagales bacterium]|nr:helix-turn-helix domain-containing protein [Chitinophagaceae bacterium]MCB9065436.1 helix-turn-helix domain-containing protein [Chitinophagales bacterium]